MQREAWIDGEMAAQWPAAMCDGAYRHFRRQGPDMRMEAGDRYYRVPFPFVPPLFSFLCSDLSRYSVAEAVAASMAVPVLFAPGRTYGLGMLHIFWSTGIRASLLSASITNPAILRAAESTTRGSRRRALPRRRRAGRRSVPVPGPGSLQYRLPRAGWSCSPLSTACLAHR